MRKTALFFTLPALAALAACGEPIDGSDTADLEADVVTTPGGEDAVAGENPAEDGMLQTDVEPAPMDAETSDPAMEDTDPAM